MAGFYNTLQIEHNRCPDGCSLCQLACARARGDGRAEAARIHAVHAAEVAFHGAVTCAQCSDPACLTSCPTGAITKSAADGTVRISESKCIGCALCTLACVWAGVYLDQERQVAVKCDRCDGAPQCVDACPHGVLTYLRTGEMRARLEIEDPFGSGTALCAGCPAEIALRLTGRIAGPNTVLIAAAGCAATAFTGFGERAACRLPVSTTLFTNVASTAAGMKRYFQRQGKDTHVVAFVGDGATVDIGFQPLSGAAERGENIVYICYDNQGYMNTGIQRSGSTPVGAWTTTTPVGQSQRGKREDPKNLPLLMAFHNIPYVATATVGFLDDYVQKLQKALAVRDGMAYLHLLSPCPTGWRTRTDSSITLARLAVETNLFPLWEAEHGKLSLTHRVVEPRSVREYIRLNGRFDHLSEEDVQELQDRTNRRYALIQSLDSLP